MIVALAAFRISIESPSQPFMPNDIYNINLMVAPMWGLYSNMTAQLVSQVSSHFILMYQRRIEASASAKFMSNNKSNNIIQGDTMPDSGSIKIVAEEKSTKQMDEEGGQLDEVDLELHGEDQSPGSPNVTLPEHSSTFSSGSHSTNKFNLENVPLSRQVFYRAHRDETDGLVTRRGVNGLVIFGALAIVALTVVGCTLPSFATESQGVLGLMVGLGRGDGLSTTYHSIFSVSKLLVNMSEFLDQTKDLIGLLSISTLFILTTLVVPLALTLAQLFRWFYPFAKDSSALLDIWIEILEAWQYVEVYVVTVLLAVWQLGDISEFMINSECDQFKSFFASMSYFNILSEDEAQCFRMQPTIESGTYILLSATILLAVLRTFLTLAVRQVEYQSSLLSMSTPGMEAKNVEDEKDTDRMVNAIAPFPVLFTDRFRWLLVKS
jgi:Paraquat-inducible protein A